MGWKQAAGGAGGESNFKVWTTLLYGGVLLASGDYFRLQKRLAPTTLGESAIRKQTSRKAVGGIRGQP
jgi:hypothetical protein